MPCRKIGELKNGEEKTFSIDNEARRLFVIADKISKDICSELYSLPAGEEDISLSGQCRFNMVRGNMFRFDGVADEATLQNRKSGSKRMTVVLIIAAICGGVIGFCNGMGWFDSPAKPKTFKTDDFSITLTDEYEKTTFEGMTAAYECDDAAVLLLKESVASVQSVGVETAQEYVEVLIEYYDLLNPSEVQTKDALLYFEYEGQGDDGKTTKFLCFVFKTNENYYTVQFLCFKSDYADLKDDFFTYAQSIRFAEEVENV